MELVLIFLIICIVICFLAIWYISIFNKYQDYIVRINEAEANIDSTLRKRFDLLNKSISLIKGTCNIQEDILEVIIKLRSRKLSNFELDRQLYDAINEFNTFKEKYPELKSSESFLRIELGIHESESEIIAFRKYYNDIITKYNKLIRSFPSNFVGKISHFEEKTYFDGKNMNDDIINDFKL